MTLSGEWELQWIRLHFFFFKAWVGWASFGIPIPNPEQQVKAWSKKDMAQIRKKQKNLRYSENTNFHKINS